LFQLINVVVKNIIPARFPNITMVLIEYNFKL